MTSDPAPVGSPSRINGYWLAPYVLGIAGILITFYPTLSSGFSQLQDTGPDAQMIHYLLEHSFLWLSQRPSHQSLWSAPIFYPQPNTTAYTESNLGIAPFYFLWRLLGFREDTSYQLFLMALLATNYVVGYLFFSKALRTSRLASSVGAFLFAFGNSRVARLPHANLVCHLYIMVTLFALVRLSRSNLTRSAGIKWIGILFLALVLQLYAGYYFAFFLFLLVSTMGLTVLVFPEYRRSVLMAGGRYWRVLATFSILAVVALLPIVIAYARALRELGAWRYEDFSASLPGFESWLFMGHRNWLYGWLGASEFFASSAKGLRNINGIGYFTAIVCSWGLWRHRRETYVRFILVCTALIIVLAFRFPGGHSVWQYVLAFVPGAQAIRSVGRIGMLLLLPASIGLTLLYDFFITQGRVVTAVVMGMLIAVEQVNVHDVVAKNGQRERYEGLAELVAPECGSFYFCSAVQGRRTDLDADALWIQIRAGIPTVNGRAALTPRGWHLTALREGKELQPGRIRADLASWLRDKGVNVDDVCVAIEPRWMRRSQLAP